MFDRYLICPYGLRNVISETGHMEGFEMKIRIPYYRGVPLSIIDEIKIDVRGGAGGPGKTYSNENIRFTVSNGSYMMSEMSTVSDRRWNFDEDATLKIFTPGGLLYYDHQVEIWITIRAPYGKFTGHDKKVLPLEADKVLTVAA